MNKSSHEKILNYNESWKTTFESEKKILEDKLKNLALFIDHIGSTSIPKLSSKSIIDIAVMIGGYGDRGKLTKPLQELGYFLKGPGNERDFYTKGDPIKFHVSVCFSDRGGFYPRQIAFRDYLRSHDKEREEYDELKRKLLAEDQTGIENYIVGKTDFVNDVLQKAKWQEKNYIEYKKRIQN